MNLEGTATASLMLSAANATNVLQPLMDLDLKDANVSNLFLNSSGIISLLFSKILPLSLRL